MLNDQALIRRAEALIRKIEKYQMIGEISHKRMDEKTQYKKALPRARKRRGGSPPIDFTAVELKVDLERELSKEPPEIDIIAKFYYPLARLVGF